MRGSAPKSGAAGRSWAQRFVFLVLIIGAFGLMMMAKADAVIVERVRMAIADAMTPVLDALSEPAGAISKGTDVVKTLWSQQDEIRRLQQENEKLRKWQRVAESLERENEQLRDLLRFAPDPAPREVLGARVITDQGVFRKSKLVNAGRNMGVERGQAVMTGDALVGRVVEVGDRSARVLLVTDINSRIPVVITNKDRSRTPAILAGNNNSEPLLRYVPEAAPIRPGDQVVTSGTGGLFQPGLPIGEVKTVEEGLVRVKLYSDLDRLEMVRLIDFGLKSVLDLKYDDQGTADPSNLQAQRPGESR